MAKYLDTGKVDQFAGYLNEYLFKDKVDQFLGNINKDLLGVNCMDFISKDRLDVHLKEISKGSSRGPRL
eukprot:4275897-Prorocentrum_lima.AAC.1